MSLNKKFSKDNTICEVTFTLSKEAIHGGTTVKLVGEFNNWNLEEGIALIAKKDEFKTVLKLETGKQYQYRYLVDGHLWTNDATPDAYVKNPFGTVNSVVALEAPTAKKTTTKKVAAKKTATKKTTAKTTVAKTAADNLTKIEGIGPKIAELLNAASIVTFADLATTKITVLKTILAEAGSRFKMHNPSSWSKQAKLAAKGDWDKLQKLQDELNGGV